MPLTTLQQTAKAIAATGLCRLGSAISVLADHRIRSRGVRMHLESHWVDATTRGLLVAGIYENAERRCLRYLRRDLPVIELGASIGFMAAQIAKRLAGHRWQVAVEANPRLVPILSNTLELNRLPHVQVVQAAVDYSGRSHVGVALSTSSVGARTLDVAAQPLREFDVVEVPATTLSRLVQEHIPVGPYCLVADIEGAELELLMQEQPETMNRCVQVLAEFHPVQRHGKSYQPQDIANIAQERWGFHVRARDGNVWFLER